jgi:hypothetical protein
MIPDWVRKGATGQLYNHIGSDGLLQKSFLSSYGKIPLNLFAAATRPMASI